MQKLPKDLPETPGVYIFKNSDNVPTYIGKAKNLKRRVSSYFKSNLIGKTKLMVTESETLSYIKVDSEFESLLLEARLVRKYMPKYNIELKDDKSPLYIAITKDNYPIIKTFRRTDFGKIKTKAYFGPFPQSSIPKKVLRNLRSIFPYSEHLPSKRVCIYRELGLCNPCPSEIELETNLKTKEILRKKYLKNVNQIKKILDGRLTQVKKFLIKQMQELSNQEMFEQAQEAKQKLQGIEYLQTRASPEEYLKNPNFLVDIRNSELENLKNIISGYKNIKKLERIECFDVAHTAGSFPTASMVTFINGEPEKSLYRHFRVKKGKKSDDLSQMRGVLERRKKQFKNWSYPDLIIIDGGKTQLKTAEEVITEVPVVSLAKRFETIIVKVDNKYIEKRLPIGPAKNLVQRIRNEAHRFARRYHHYLINKNLT
ncbi:GIY-YIG nuclease family protein [Candidatus Woesebacteria bacterium]|nr:GIY-YIG nuclease family protein [Candidatus Woesebacteria bacterium]QQG47180.1 MAG: GIY-YIG nuclease family protein [Candidatus Woesebacteria bacterium]